MKPFDRDELRARVRVGVRIVGLQTSMTAMFAFAQAVEGRSKYTHGHSDRVRQYALALAKSLGLARDQLEVLGRGALLHDIGKISIPDSILDKPGRLTTEEMETMKQHPLEGVKLIQPWASLRDVIPLIRSHHERLDGRGYPDGLYGPAIPFMVRILSVADVYDALASERPYRPAMPHDQCIAILRSDAASAGLDVELVESFCRTVTGPIVSTAPEPLSARDEQLAPRKVS